MNRDSALRTPISEHEAGRRSLQARLWSVALAMWGAITGVAPHVLHHVGPLAGAAILAGAGGRVVFALIAMAASIPLLLRIYRRYGTLWAPTIAVAVMAVMFSVSSFILGPAISGDSSDEAPKVDHSQHQQHSP